MTSIEQLEIIARHVGAFATRLSLNSGSYVVAHMDGRYTCIHRKCIDARISDKCVHVAFVREHDSPDDEGQAQPDERAIEHDALPDSDVLLDDAPQYLPPF